MRRLQSARVYLGLEEITGILTDAVIYVILREPMVELVWGGGFFILKVVGLAT